MTIVLFWIAAAVVFLVIEMSTAALVSLWFTVGALAALGLSLLKLALWAQVLAFLAVSGALLAMLRPMLKKHVKITRTNVDSLIGKKGIVTADIDNLSAVGQIKLNGMEWTARSSSGNPIPAGTVILVDRIEGVKAYVTPVKAEAKV